MANKEWETDGRIREDEEISKLLGRNIYAGNNRWWLV